jgi:hypothetical protein
MRLCPTPMDRMLTQDVVGLDGYPTRCMQTHPVDLHRRRGLHQFPRIALEAVLPPPPRRSSSSSSRPSTFSTLSAIQLLKEQSSRAGIAASTS